MPPAIQPISAVASRIQSIEQRFAPERRSPTLIVQPGEAFDPFGEAYQQALEQRPAPSRPVTSSLPIDAGSVRYLTEVASRSGRPVTTEIDSVATWRIGPGSAGEIGPGSAGKIGGFGSMPVPEPLAVFGNGRIPSEELSPIRQSGHRLYAPAAAAWDRMVDAAAADGLDLRLTDSYRSYENQVDLVRRKGLYSQGGLAAKPGTSNHGWGLAVDADVTDPAMLAWIREHGRDFGWVEAVPREPWHWEYRPHQA